MARKTAQPAPIQKPAPNPIRYENPPSSMAYARFRQEIVSGILERKLTPEDVAELLSERMADFPEIAREEVDSLSAMGSVWQAHGAATLRAIDEHSYRQRRAGNAPAHLRERLADF